MPAPRRVAGQTGGEAARAVLQRTRPQRIVYAPNYWQWFSHHRAHNSLPRELSDCRSQLDLLRYLGVDVVSRNLYCDQRRAWFGGLSDIVWENVEVVSRETAEGTDLAVERLYHTAAGTLSERQRYVHQQSTLVQEKFLVDDYAEQLDAYQRLVEGRRWRFHPARYDHHQQMVGPHGLVVAGELHSPLKMLHLDLGPERTTYFLMDYPQRAAELMRIHEAAQLDLLEQIVSQGVPAVMAMDNLDTLLHSPRYVERYAASFYERASRLCHSHGSTFWIHACGRQRANLRLIASLGVDGLEGVAFPPIGDVWLHEALELTGDRFLITGGITAAETDRFESREAVFRYVRDLFERMAPYAHRFVFASSCNTAISARWEQLVWFRDAWLEYGAL